MRGTIERSGSTPGRLDRGVMELSLTEIDPQLKFGVKRRVRCSKMCHMYLCADVFVAFVLSPLPPRGSHKWSSRKVQGDRPRRHRKKVQLEMRSISVHWIPVHSRLLSDQSARLYLAFPSSW